MILRSVCVTLLLDRAYTASVFPGPKPVQLPLGSANAYRSACAGSEPRTNRACLDSGQDVAIRPAFASRPWCTPVRRECDLMRTVWNGSRLATNSRRLNPDYRWSAVTHFRPYAPYNIGMGADAGKGAAVSQVWACRGLHPPGPGRSGRPGHLSYRTLDCWRESLSPRKASPGFRVDVNR